MYCPIKVSPYSPLVLITSYYVRSSTLYSIPLKKIFISRETVSFREINDLDLDADGVLSGGVDVVRYLLITDPEYCFLLKSKHFF